ncbi:MAG: hypothetical protein IKW91_09520 [Bacteroidaceae bacterium]|jgi:uncharacterized protein YoxC|nr:hypothetical protein [Bacteroidaceae bacterium]
MSWATLLKAGLKFMGSGAKATAKTVGHTVLHPQQTIKGMGTATKTAAVGAATGYVAWEKLTTDKSVARIVGDAVVGSDTIDSVGEKVEGVGNAVSSLGETASNAMNSVSDAVNGANSNLNGINNFLGNMSGGNGGNMFSNFFSNLFSGNVSGMSMLGLVASAFLIFGRFGWLGKIAGVLLGMMMIGNNASLNQALGGGTAQQKPQTPANDPQKALGKPQAPLAQQPVAVVYEPEEERPVVHRSR